MVSASASPPAVYLKDLIQNSEPILLRPRASEAAVCVAAFHPQRANIFLLAFLDGTIAAYDATKLQRQGLFAEQGNGHDGEIARLRDLHRTTAKTCTKTGITTRPVCITGAAFLPGYKTRAVTVGSDGRCRLIDSADGGVILRTWHTKAALTSVSVWSIRSNDRNTLSTPSRGARTYRTPPALGGPAGTDSVIAVGRADGKVHLYDPVGLLLAQKSCSDIGERVISVEWIQGPAPRPINSGLTMRDVSDAPSVPLRGTTARMAVPATIAEPSRRSYEKRKISTSRGVGLGLPPSLRRPDTAMRKSASRMFTVHPDEAAECTVRHTPSPLRKDVVPSSASRGPYLDLFTPVRVPDIAKHPAYRLTSGASPARARITSQFFVRNPEPDVDAARTATTSAQKLGLLPSADSGSATARPVTASHRMERGAAVATEKRHLGVRAILEHQLQPPALPADIRPKRKTQESGNIQSSRALPDTQTAPAKLRHRRPHHPHLLPHPVTALLRGPAKQKYWDPGNVLEREATWPTDSEQLSSLGEPDTWLTEDAKEDQAFRQCRLDHKTKQPARPASPQKAGPELRERKEMAHRTEPDVLRRFDGSTEEGDYVTAGTYIAADGAFVPSSKDIYELFPRASSLSPKRHRRSKRTDMASKPGNYDEAAIVAGVVRQKSDPWARVRAGKQGAQSSRRDDWIGPDQGKHQSGCCEQCAQYAGNVSVLKEELARLKTEVIALNRLLKRSTVQVPRSVRREA